MTESRPTAKKADPRIGQTISDKYRIDRKLGEGGMGAVYEAEHTLIGRKVAIKLLRPEVAEEESILTRFQREARAATAIGHDHIVEVMDMGSLDDGSTFMILEYLQGQDLDELLKSERLTVGRLVHILDQTCDALAAAHAKGIIHRDLKPANIFLVDKPSDRDFVKVLDFGIAKQHAAEGAEASGLTQTGVALGTPAYMSPEQAQNVKGIDHRSDIYSLGVILFEALAGRRPFEGESFVQLMVAVVCDPAPSLSLLRPDLPTELTQLVDHLLSKDPEERVQDCLSLREALRPFADLDDDPDSVPTEATSADSTPTEAATQADRPQARADAAKADAAKAELPPTAVEKALLETMPAPKAEGRPDQPSIAGVEVDRDRPQKKRGLMIALVAAGAVILLGGVLAFAGVFGDEADATEEPPTAASQTPDPPEKAQPLVRVQIETEPSHAILFLDDERIANPFDAELPQQQEPRSIKAQLEGFETVTESLSLRYAQTIHLELDPLTAEVDAGADETDATPAVATKREPRRPRRTAKRSPTPTKTEPPANEPAKTKTEPPPEPPPPTKEPEEPSSPLKRIF